MTFSIHQLPHALAAVLSLWIAAVVWRRRPAPGAPAFAGAILGMGIWSVTNALEWGSPNLEVMLGWIRLQFVAIAAIPVLWFLFAMRFSGRRGWSEGPRSWLLWVLPTITILLAWTDAYHGLMIGPLTYDASLAYPGVRHVYGPWFWVHTAYSYALLAYGTVVLISSLASGPGLYRGQLVTVCCAVVVPVAGNIAYIFGFSPMPGLDLTPPLFVFSATLVGWSLLRWRFLDLVPSARATVVESMADGVIVVDRRGRVVDMNPAAQGITGRKADAAVGLALVDLFPTETGWLARLAGHEEATAELALFAADHPGRYYEVRAMPLHGARGQETGRLLLLRNVSERRRADEERERLIEQLREAVSNVRTLSGLIPICAACKKVRDDQGYWQQVEEYVSAHSQVEFSHGLCPECMARLYPGSQALDAPDDVEAQAGTDSA